MLRLKHDPELAAKISDVLKDMGYTDGKLQRWLELLEEMADTLGYILEGELVIPHKHSSSVHVLEDTDFILEEFAREYHRRLRVVTFKLPEDEVELIDTVARQMGLTRSELIRSAIYCFLQDLGVTRL